MNGVIVCGRRRGGGRFVGRGRGKSVGRGRGRRRGGRINKVINGVDIRDPNIFFTNEE